ncbi:transposase [Sulfurimonas sp. HSL3-7]
MSNWNGSKTSGFQIVIQLWRNKWKKLSNCFNYRVDIHRIVYATNIIKSVHRQISKLTKTKGGFLNENSLLKLLYMEIQKQSQFL